MTNPVYELYLIDSAKQEAKQEVIELSSKDSLEQVLPRLKELIHSSIPANEKYHGQSLFFLVAKRDLPDQRIKTEKELIPYMLQHDVKRTESLFAQFIECSEIKENPEPLMEYLYDLADECWFDFGAFLHEHTYLKIDDPKMDKLYTQYFGGVLNGESEEAFYSVPFLLDTSKSMGSIERLYPKFYQSLQEARVLEQIERLSLSRTYKLRVRCRKQTY